jgi:uncharacterized membrane protein
VTLTQTHKDFNPDTQGRRVEDSMDFYHNWTNSILQQLETKFWKIADELFRILWMTNSFKERTKEHGDLYYHYSLVPD